jgi:acyl-CoA thioesterase-2
VAGETEARFDLDELLGCLALNEVEPDVVEGPNLDIGYHRVFGGQILAQILTAASVAAPDKSVKSMSVLFPREGDTAKPMRYRVTTRLRGRTFAACEVLASQDGPAIALAVVSLHVDEDGMHRSDAPPQVGPPGDAVPRSLSMVPWETRMVGGVDLGDRGAGPAQLEIWMKSAPVGDDRAVHQALLAHATDLTLIGTALRPFAGVSQADSTVSLQTAVTSHSMWFHQPFRVDDWLLVVQQAPVVANGRAFGRGDVFSGRELVASFAQESMIRRVEDRFSSPCP